MKNDFTLLIQGKLLDSTYKFYFENYNEFPIIISTWEDCTLIIDDSIQLIKSKYPDKFGNGNGNLQVHSTLIGLENVKTKYVLKLRGDEQYSNLQHAMQLLTKNDDKILTSPIFFRKWEVIKYHISDHLIIGKTENLLKMFKTTYHKFNDANADKLYKKEPPESVLGKSYIEERELKKLTDDIDNTKLMIKYYDILDLDNYKPYKIVANCFKKVWIDNFIPEKELSISNIKEL
jgi:hypothetical protein